MLGTWLFALFVGIANACLPGQPLGSHPAAHAVVAGHHANDGLPANCAKFCNEDTPLFAKLQLVQDQPSGQPLLVPVQSPTLVEPHFARVATTLLVHPPPPDVPVLLRSFRLAL